MQSSHVVMLPKMVTLADVAQVVASVDRCSLDRVMTFSSADGDVKRAMLAQSWTVETQNQFRPLLTRPVTAFIGVKGWLQVGLEI